MDKSEKAREEMVATLLGCIIKTFCGEETVDELVEMTRIKHKIDKCLAEPTTIPTSLVERFNELCKKHFTVDEESSTKRTIRVKDAGELHIDDIGE